MSICYSTLNIQRGEREDAQCADARAAKEINTAERAFPENILGDDKRADPAFINVNASSIL